MTLHLDKAVTAAPAPAFLAGGGEMGAAIRDFDWAATVLGPPAQWPRTLKTCLSILLASRQPMWVWWGPELINFYNDPYLSIIGAKHPGALGQPARKVWAEIWDQIRGRITAAMEGEASYSEAELLVMQRNGYPEETYYTFSFSPVPDDDGGIGGIVCANTDDTDRVIGGRQLALLRQIASRTWDADSVDEVYTLSAQALACDPRDMPFAMIYGLEQDGVHARLRGTSGIAPGHAAAPETIMLERGATWPIGEVVRGGRRVLTRLGERFGSLPKGPWDDVAQDALMLPLSISADAAPRGVLILAVNPYRRRSDDNFENFATLVARQIAASAVNIEIFETERERAKSADSLALEIEHRRRIERHQNLLLDELNHRVKNTLATVQAMATQTLKGVEAGPRDTFLARLFALSSQHDLLTMDNWEGASLEGVVRRALRPWRETAGRPRFRVEGPAVHLDTKRALALGMVFHELATNAANHGALSNANGMVKVVWTLEPDGKLLKLCWEEEGGPKVGEPQRRGFGLRVIEHGLAREISGKVTLDFRPQGLLCAWDMKLV